MSDFSPKNFMNDGSCEQDHRFMLYSPREEHLTRPQGPTACQESEMAANSLHELQATKNVGHPAHRLRLLCLSRGANGILRLGRLFRRMEEDSYKKLDFEDFVFGLKKIGLEINQEEAKEMFDVFDTDENGTLNVDKFLLDIRPPLSSFRTKVIEEAFEKIDKSGKGEITIDELKHVYNVKSQTRYKSGEDSEESILNTFLKNFEQDATENEMITVTKEQFVDYYAAISTSIDNDCYFDLMMRQTYIL